MTKDRIWKVMGEFYGLKVNSLDIIQRLLLRQSYLLDTSLGKIVLKKYSPNYNKYHLGNIWDFIEYLNDSGMKSLEIVYMKNGQRFYADNNEYYVAYKYLEGNKSEIEDSYAIGKMLREFHDNSRRITKNKMPGFNIRQDIKKACNEIKKYKSYKDCLLAHKITSNMKIFLDILHQYYISDDIIIHGDFTLNNVIKQNNNYYLIDLDTIRVGNFMEDLACFSLSLCYNGNSKLQIKPRYVEILQFLQGYFQNMETSDFIIDGLINNMRFHCAYELAGFAKNYMITKRYKGTEEYLNMLVDTVITNGFGLGTLLKDYIRCRK